MSTILYYSNYCKSSSKVLQILSKYDMSNKVHFICIDGRINKNGETYAVLQNGQEILIPKNITAVPALLLLNQQYLVIYGVSEIINYFQKGMDQQIREATKNNMVPMSKGQSQSQRQSQSQSQERDYDGFGGFFTSSGVVSDNFSFLDQDEVELTAKGNGGLRQMHHYAKPDDDILFGGNDSNSTTSGNRMKDDDASSLVNRYKEERDKDMQMYMPKREF